LVLSIVTFSSFSAYVYIMTARLIVARKSWQF